MTIKNVFVTTFENVTDTAHALGTHDPRPHRKKKKNEHMM